MYSFFRKSMEDEELDVPLKNIRNLKNININKISKKPDEVKIVLEIAMETIQYQQRKIRNFQSHINKLQKRVQSLTPLNKHLHDNNFISDKALEHLNVSI